MEQTDSKKPSKSLIYTKTGDKGTSQLYSGERLSKTNSIFEAMGNVDELSANIGVARQHCQATNNGLDEYLELIQSHLVDVGSNIATPRTSDKASETKLVRTSFSETRVTELETWIDQTDSQLPPLKNFILPSGGLSSSHLHVARAICRRAERSIWPLVHDGSLDEAVAIYVNRLSDYLFVAARYAAMKEGKQETIYRQGERKVLEKS